MITSRPLEPSDVEAAVALLHAYDRRWFGEPVLTLEDVRADWARPGFELARDSEGWFEDGGPDGEALVAFATLSTRGDLEVAVDAAWADAGLQEALLQRWEDEARRRGQPAVHRELAADDVDGVARLTGRGWFVERTGWLLQLEEATPLAPAPLPDGYAVRPAREADLPVVHRVVVDAFAAYNPVVRTYEDWLAGTVERPDVVVDHWRLATLGGPEGDVVGACLLQEPPVPGEDGEAWVPQLAVAQAHRRRGLAAALLSRTALAARERGVPRLGLYTHDGTGALSLYESIGMRVLHTLRTCTLTL